MPCCSPIHLKAPVTAQSQNAITTNTLITAPYCPPKPISIWQPRSGATETTKRTFIGSTDSGMRDGRWTTVSGWRVLTVVEIPALALVLVYHTDIHRATNVSSLHQMFQIRHCRRYSTNLNHYQVLQLPINASIKEIRTQFRKLSKEFHPDLNTHLNEEEKQQNNEKYLLMVNAYDTLKDVKKKKQYDNELRMEGSSPGFGATSNANRAKREWQNKYYGEAKYYSKSGYQSYSSGYRYKPHETVHSPFSGTHRNYGDRFDVPHFDYNSHLHKHLQFERRIIDKSLSQQEQTTILNHLQKSGVKLNDETITKHLLRHIHRKPQTFAAQAPTASPYIYQPRKDDGDAAFLPKFLVISGASMGIYLLYNALSK